MNPDPRDSISTRDPDTQPIPAVRTGERQRAAIALGVLAIAALIVVGVMVAVLGSNNSNNAPTTNGAPTGPPVSVIHQPSGHASGHPSGHPTKQHQHHHKLPPRRPGNATVSCPTGSPCDLPDDVGGAVQALNAYRAQHGKPAVRGAVTHAARTCAVTAGDQCPNGFYWEPVGRNGHQVIQKIAANGGDSWLLDERMTTVQVGWAYIPASKSFECALVSNAP
jgi:hypothetical protein